MSGSMAGWVWRRWRWLKGARIIRTHDVGPDRDAIGTVSAVLQGMGN